MYTNFKDLLIDFSKKRNCIKIKLLIIFNHEILFENVIFIYLYLHESFCTVTKSIDIKRCQHLQNTWSNMWKTQLDWKSRIEIIGDTIITSIARIIQLRKPFWWIDRFFWSFVNWISTVLGEIHLWKFCHALCDKIIDFTFILYRWSRMVGIWLATGFRKNISNYWLSVTRTTLLL